ncbi:MAG: hypothetical protein VKJ64_13105 [Leptolyngbyaceae bacterium]|nr:hypothetical protein [Leptolyngbyaceae bacterium]
MPQQRMKYQWFQRIPRNVTLADWGSVSSVLTDLERQVLPQGQTVVVVAGLKAHPEGNQLVDPLGDRLTILLGTEQGIRTQGQQMRLIFVLLWIPLGWLSWHMARSAQSYRQEFVQRSNQPEGTG